MLYSTASDATIFLDSSSVELVQRYRDATPVNREAFISALAEADVEVVELSEIQQSLDRLFELGLLSD
ncbi:hypothetical protein [Bowmanella denitrificans]|uniref:hypothetical protein n=1 Tax=Bowmanella denitrificans TaxID=366582 RepID=UPI000C9B08D7|nr:hypothetical protein [Bowmanella denitrificans]